MQSTTALASGATTHANSDDADDQLDGRKNVRKNLMPAVAGNRNGDYAPPRAVRSHLPDERVSVTHKFSVGGHEGYITVGLYPDQRPGEIFIKMSKEGSTLSGVMDGLARTLSIGLQYGVPLKV